MLRTLRARKLPTLKQVGAAVALNILGNIGSYPIRVTLGYFFPTAALALSVSCAIAA